MSKSVTKNSSTREKSRARRHRRVRKTVAGTPERPRLAVYRSNAHIYAQVIDDSKGHTLAAASTQTAELRSAVSETDKKGAAKLVGEHLAKLCKAANIESVVFDRGGYIYKGGRVKALAEGAREGGLKF